MNIWLVLSCTLFSLSVYILIKNHFVYKNTNKARVIIFSGDDWRDLLKKHDLIDGYYRRTVNPFKWTFKQMFPGLQP